MKVFEALRAFCSACVTYAFKNLTPVPADFLEDQVVIGVEAAVHRKDFVNASRSNWSIRRA